MGPAPLPTGGRDRRLAGPPVAHRGAAAEAPVTWGAVSASEGGVRAHRVALSRGGRESGRAVRHRQNHRGVLFSSLLFSLRGDRRFDPYGARLDRARLCPSEPTCGCRAGRAGRARRRGWRGLGPVLRPGGLPRRGPRRVLARPARPARYLGGPGRAYARRSSINNATIDFASVIAPESMSANAFASGIRTGAITSSASRFVATE